MSALFLSLDVLGLSLAIIGFLGIADPLERYFAKLTMSAQALADWSHELRDELWPPHKHWLTLIVGSLKELARWSMIFALSITVQRDWERAIEFLPSWPLWVWAGAAPVILVLNVALYTLSCLLGPSVLLWLCTGVWKAFDIMSKPRGGVLGTIGLALALTSALLNRLSGALTG